MDFLLGACTFSTTSQSAQLALQLPSGSLQAAASSVVPEGPSVFSDQELPPSCASHLPLLSGADNLISLQAQLKLCSLAASLDLAPLCCPELRGTPWLLQHQPLAACQVLAQLGLQDPRHRGLLCSWAPRVLSDIHQWPPRPRKADASLLIRLLAFTDGSAAVSGAWPQIFVSAGRSIVLFGLTAQHQWVFLGAVWGASPTSAIAWRATPHGICGGKFTPLQRFWRPFVQHQLPCP